MNLVDIFHNESIVPALNNIRLANSFWPRLRGLLARPPLKSGDGLLLLPCGSVHTVAMKYPLDVIFMNKQGNIVKLIQEMKPYRFGGSGAARYALELAPGSIRELGINLGDRLTWVRR